MKKTENINLGGKAFTIDLDAYKALEKYLNMIGSKFKRNGAKAEIMEDIESRLAELLEENLIGRDIVTSKDIDTLKQTMGGPEAFAEEENIRTFSNQSSHEQHNSTHTIYKERRKRLYRDVDDKVIGGVCSGLSNYFGFDSPVWLRLFFAFVFLFGGSGLFIYLILWIALPGAITMEEKIEMNSNPVHLDDITDNIKSEVVEVKESIENIVKH